MKLHRMTAAALLAQPSFGRISPDEEALLRDFVREYARPYGFFSIDVPISARLHDVETSSSVIDRMWAAITRRRIDALAYHGGGVDVIEAKVHATMRAATQVRQYRDAYERTYAFRGHIRPVIVCRSAVPGLAGLLMTLGGRLIEIPAIGAAGVDVSFTFPQESSHG